MCGVVLLRIGLLRLWWCCFKCFQLGNWVFGKKKQGPWSSIKNKRWLESYPISEVARFEKLEYMTCCLLLRKKK